MSGTEQEEIIQHGPGVFGFPHAKQSGNELKQGVRRTNKVYLILTNESSLRSISAFTIQPTSSAPQSLFFGVFASIEQVPFIKRLYSIDDRMHTRLRPQAEKSASEENRLVCVEIPINRWSGTKPEQKPTS
jgi:hypothetical protein